MSDQNTPAAAYQDIVRVMTTARFAVSSRMFGMDCLKINGKVFTGFYRDCMTFKLSGEAHTAALSLEGSKLFDPSDMGRPMKAWVQVPFAHVGQWLHFAESALDDVQAASKPQKKK
jgi:hypothetical protein